MERAKETGPTRPQNMAKISMMRLKGDAVPVTPAVRPAVPKAETASKRASTLDTAGEEARRMPAVRITSSTPKAVTASAL